MDRDLPTFMAQDSRENRFCSRCDSEICMADSTSHNLHQAFVWFNISNRNLLELRIPGSIVLRRVRYNSLTVQWHFKGWSGGDVVCLSNV